jgi:hypothetical protein
MNERCLRVRWRERSGWAVAWLVLGLVGVAASPGGAAAQDTRSTLEPRVSAGKCVSPAGTLLASEREGQAWTVLGAQETVSSRDLLLALPGVRATVEPRPKSVTLTLWGNLPELSAFPVLESAVILHDSRSFDLDFTLAGGRVSVVNRKAEGAAQVWVRLPGEAWQLTLAEPGAEVAMEMYGRWPRGIPFTREPRPQDRPTQVVVLHVLKGQVDLKTETQRLSLAAPPGPAYFHWDSVAGAPEGPQRRDQVPSWVDPKDAPAEARVVAAVVETYQARLKDRNPDAALLDLLAAADKETDKEKARISREFAILGLAALDDLSRVAEALADPNRAAVRATAVVALRHWIGATHGRDLQLYHALINQLGYRPSQAEAVLQLLHSPFAEDQSETYETLIAYLHHDKLAIRELAWWHLSRLVPADRAVPYNPGAPAAEREKAASAWKKLLADGQLPPKPKEKK